MAEVRFRIVDLLTGRTLIESTRGRDLVAYHDAHAGPVSDWWWQYLTRYGWHAIPPQVRREWRERSAAAPSD